MIEIYAYTFFFLFTLHERNDDFDPDRVPLGSKFREARAPPLIRVGRGRGGRKILGVSIARFAFPLKGRALHVPPIIGSATVSAYPRTA